MKSNLIRAKLNMFWIQPDPMHFLQRLLAFLRNRLIEGKWIQPGSEPDPHVLPQIGDRRDSGSNLDPSRIRARLQQILGETAISSCRPCS